MTRRVAIVGAALSDSGGSTTSRPSSCTTRPSSRALADAGLTKDDVDGFASTGMGAARARRESPSTSGCGRRGSTAPAWAARRGSSCSSTRPPPSRPARVDVVLLSYGSTTRADLKRRLRRANLSLRQPRPGAVRRAVRPHAHRQVRHGGPPAHARVRHDDRAAGRDRGVGARTTPRSTPTRTTATRSRSTTSGRADDRRPVHDAALLHPLRRRRRGRARGRGPGARLRGRSRCGCSGTGEAMSHTTMSEWAGLHRVAGPAQRRGRVRAGGPDARRRRRVPALRRVHVDGAAHARGARLLREGRGRCVRRGRQAAGRRRAADEHRRRRPVALPPGHAGDVPAGRGGAPAAGRGGAPAGARCPDRVRQRHGRLVLVARRPRSWASSELWSRPRARRRSRGGRGRRGCRATCRRRRRPRGWS